MKKFFIFLLSTLLVLSMALFMSSCKKKGDSSQQVDEIYEIYQAYVARAEKQGRTPISYEEWLNSIRGEQGPQGEQGIQGEAGQDGVGVQSVVINEKGELVITYTDETSVNIGVVVGKDGADGAQGEQGIQGEAGQDGQNGVGVESVEQNEKGELIITLTDGKVYTFELPTQQLPEHNYGEWISFTTGDATCEERMLYRICATCNTIEWRQGSYDDHVWGEAYCTDEYNHWFECEKCNEIKDNGTHSVDDNGKCQVCGLEGVSTAGLAYSTSTDGTYAYVSGYTGTASEVKIAKNYKGLPVTSIGKNAFNENTTVASVVIPDSVTSIENAFIECTNLTKVNYTGSIDSWVQMDFMGPESNPAYHANNLYINDVLVTEANITTATEIKAYVFKGCKGLTSVNISDSVTSIGAGAFNGSGLTSATIGNSVTTIGSNAFRGCSGLTSLTIPNSVTSIGHDAFRSLSGLTSLTIPDSVKTIGYWAFGYCESLTSVTIGSSVTSIGESAFYGCESLTSVTMGSSVTSIGEFAFIYCYKLTKVYYAGTASDWEEILIRLNNQSLMSATRYYYSKTQPTTEGNYWHYDENGNVVEW